MNKKIKIYKSGDKIIRVTGLPKDYTWASRRKKVVKKADAFYRFCSERLSLERLRRGFSYRELASLIEDHSCGTIASQSLVYNWERLGQAPSGLHFCAICKIFNKEPDYFIVDKDESYDFEEEFNEIYDAIPERGPRERFRAEYFAHKAEELAKQISKTIS